MTQDLVHGCSLRRRSDSLGTRPLWATVSRRRTAVDASGRVWPSLCWRAVGISLLRHRTGSRLHRGDGAAALTFHRHLPLCVFQWHAAKPPAACFSVSGPFGPPPQPLIFSRRPRIRHLWTFASGSQPLVWMCDAWCRLLLVSLTVSSLDSDEAQPKETQLSRSNSFLITRILFI